MKRVEVHGRADHRDPAGAGGGREDGGCLPQARHQQRDVLQVEGEVRRDGRVGRPAAEGRSRTRTRKLKKLLAEAMLDNAMLKDIALKKMVTPVAKRQAVAHLVPGVSR